MHFMYPPSQRKATLQYNVVSHWAHTQYDPCTVSMYLRWRAFGLVILMKYEAVARLSANGWCHWEKGVRQSRKLSTKQDPGKIANIIQQIASTPARVEIFTLWHINRCMYIGKMLTFSFNARRVIRVKAFNLSNPSTYLSCSFIQNKKSPTK